MVPDAVGIAVSGYEGLPPISASNETERKAELQDRLHIAGGIKTLPISSMKGSLALLIANCPALVRKSLFASLSNSLAFAPSFAPTPMENTRRSIWMCQA